MKTYVNAGGTVTLDTQKLTLLRQALVGFERARVRVGILGGGVRPDGETNASIGLKMEYGQMTPSCTTPQQEKALNRGPMCWSSIPERSFLRMPMIKKLPDEIKTITTLDWVELIITTGYLNTLSFLGAMAEGVIQNAFDTRGFGHWLPNSWRTVLWKKSSQPLVDTGQLRQVITSKAVRS